MKLGSLKPSDGAHKTTKRRGRGPGTGLGKTAGRGHKGAGSRSGNKQRSWYEGGQMSLARRLPKRGFSNDIFRKEYQIINLNSLETLGSETVNAQILFDNGLVKSLYRPIKVLGDGELSKVIHVTVDAISAGAREKIEKLGGSATIL